MRTRTRFGATTFAAAFLMAAFTVLAGPAQAAPVVKISKIYYNSPGSDTGSNASLNSEYVTLQNTTTTARTITGWTLRDKANHVYKFPSTTIKAKSTRGERSDCIHDAPWSPACGACTACDPWPCDASPTCAACPPCAPCPAAP